MELILGNEAGIPSKDRPTAVALGFFDGVHLGHRAIIKQMQQMAQETHLTTVVHTFQVAPKILLGKTNSAIQITSLQEKAAVLSTLQVDYTVADDFTVAYRSMTPEEFVERVLVERLGAKAVVCGFHYHFGYGGLGNAEQLQTMCQARGICCQVIERVAKGKETVSSTAIRGLIERGEIERANELLGYRYFVLARVVHGKQNGRKMGFPTINQDIKENSIVLAKGVYITRVEIDGNWHTGITNVGRRPSIDGGGRENIETYIFDWDADLYGRELKVEFIKHVRGERKFDSLDALQAQIAADKAFAMEYISRSGEN